MRRRADFVQHLDCSAADIFILVAQHGDQVPHGVRVVGAHDRIDRLLLRLDVGVAQDFAEQADVDVALEAGQRVQHRLPHELVGVLQLPLQRHADVAPVEARQDVDDVRARDRVLALEATQQFRDDARVGDVGDDAEHGRFLGRVLVVSALQHVARVETRLLCGEDADHRALRHRRLVEQAEQQVGRVIARIGQRGRDRGDGALVAFRESAGHDRERLVVQQGRQHRDEAGGFLLVGARQCVEDAGDRGRSEAHELLQRRLVTVAVVGRLDLGDQAVSAQVR